MTKKRLVETGSFVVSAILSAFASPCIWIFSCAGGFFLIALLIIAYAVWLRRRRKALKKGDKSTSSGNNLNNAIKGTVKRADESWSEYFKRILAEEDNS
jgi:membrane protein implicated in regulation of membrane protease activity